MTRAIVQSMSETRRYERIDIALPCRLYVPGADGLRFEAFCTSRNLGLGGLFVASSFLLRKGLELFVELALPDGPLPIRSRIAHAVEHDHPELDTGLGIEFLDVDAHGRETLLRYFTPQRYQTFYAAFMEEFPHLKKSAPLRDVSLVLNLWEEWKIRNEGGPLSTASGAPPATLRAGGRSAAPRARGRR
jgi:PilZ domain-containing protein